jgi:1-pyrroline-5-carboxylate dehydrogenase
MVTGNGHAVSDLALTAPDLAGIHFTGSTATFQHLWREVGANITRYRTHPRLVGETGGKEFIVAHPSADPAAPTTALIRGAFEYQGQECSAASRAYLPRSLWNTIADELTTHVDSLPMGDVTDLRNFMGAVIDARAHRRCADVLDRAARDPAVTVAAGGTHDDTNGYFVRPTVLLCDDPGHEIFRTEYFGPILAVHVHVHEDGDYDSMLARMESAAPYALTGSVLARDRAAIARTARTLRFAAGNFYINDKPTGAVVGQQPFGGGRASGTNDKAGSP